LVLHNSVASNEARKARAGAPSPREAGTTRHQPSKERSDGLSKRRGSRAALRYLHLRARRLRRALVARPHTSVASLFAARYRVWKQLMSSNAAIARAARGSSRTHQKNPLGADRGLCSTGRGATHRKSRSCATQVEKLHITSRRTVQHRSRSYTSQVDELCNTGREATHHKSTNCATQVEKLRKQPAFAR
jgi:hypothetical protein